MVIGAIGPNFSIDVSAAYGTWIDEWTGSGEGGWKVIDSTSIQIPKEEGTGSTELYHTYNWRPKKYAVQFSVAVAASSNSIGFAAETGFVRPGGYIRDGKFMSMTGGYEVPTPNSWDGEFHTYRLEIDHSTNTQKIYYDGSYAGEWTLEMIDSSWYTSDKFMFWASNNGMIKIKDVSFASLMNGKGYEFPTDYTQAYFEDYKYSEDEYLAGTTSCRVPEGFWSKYFSNDTENGGTVSIYRERVRSTSTYVEHPLKATKNFDLEYRLKMTKVDESLNQAGFTIRISTDNRYTWLSIDEDVIGFRSYGESAADPNYTGAADGIIYSVGYDWFNIKAEVRDKWITWYIKKDVDEEYKELLKYRLHGATMNFWSSAVGANYSLAEHSGGFTMDWQKYTPYFEDSFYITSPASNAEFTEGDSVSLDVNLADSGIGGQGNYRKTVDYYLNGIKVGTGNYSGKFVYNLTGLKPGIYTLKAICSDGGESAEVPFTVKRASYSISAGKKITDDLGIAFVGKDDDKWYTYKIVVGDFGGNKSFAEDHDEFVTIYRKERGAADSEYKELKGIRPPYESNNMYTDAGLADADYLYYATFTTRWDYIHLGYYAARYNASGEEKVETKYSIDNLQFATDDVAYSGYVDDTDAEIFVDSTEETEAVILASYDENNVLVDIDFAQFNGGTNFADLNIKAGSVTRLYMWNKLVGGKPITDILYETGK